MRLKRERVHPEWMVRTEFDGFTVGKENFVTEFLTDRGERRAERMARMFIGGIAPQERGEFFARVLLGEKHEVREQSLDLARGKANRLPVLFKVEGS